MIKKLLIRKDPYHQTNKYHSKIHSIINNMVIRNGKNTIYSPSDPTW